MQWKRFPLEELSESVDYGHTASASSKRLGPRFLRITDIQNDRVDWNIVPFCECGSKESERFKLRLGDIVFARTGATTGKSFLIRELAEDTVFASYLIRVRPKKSLFPPYLAHFFKTTDYWAQIASNVSGSTQPGVNAGKLKNLSIPLPPLDEQRRIAAVLDKADALREKRKAAIEQIERLIRSAFLHFICPSDGDRQWPLFSIEELASPEKGSMRTGPFGSDLRHSEFVDEGVAVLGIDNAVQNRFEWGERRFITFEKYRELKRYTVFPGDVIITIMGTTGRTAVVPEDIPTAITTKHLATITPNRKSIHPAVLAIALREHPSLQRQLNDSKRGAIMDGLNLGIIKMLHFKVPPMKVQMQFVEVLQQIRKIEKGFVDFSKDDLLLFHSLQQRAFAGELFTKSKKGKALPLFDRMPDA